MNKEEYYSRIEKIEGKLRTDRCSFDEIHNLTIQQNYLKTQYIKFLEEENEKLNHYKLLYQKVKERADELEADMKFVLEQVLGAFTQNWCIDWNFTDIREKYSISDNYEWNKGYIDYEPRVKRSIRIKED